MASYHKRDVSFVAPASKTQVAIIEAAPTQLPAPPSTVLLPTANYTDRARGFSLATAPLAGVAGLVAALVGIIGWQAVCIIGNAAAGFSGARLDLALCVCGAYPCIT